MGNVSWRAGKMLGVVGLAGSLLLGPGAARVVRADATLIPAIRTDGSDITIISVVNKAFAMTNSGSDGTPQTFTANASDQLHMMYRYSTTAGDPDPSNPATCAELDGFGSVTANDVGSFDVSNTIAAGHGIGGDSTSTFFNIGKGFRALGTLYNFSGVYPGTPGPENSLVTEVDIGNLATGELYAYRAPNDGLGTDEGDLDDLSYGSFDGGTKNPQVTIPTVRWFPTGPVSVRWLVAVADLNETFGTLAATVQLQGFVNLGIGDWFDINENPISGANFVDVLCFRYLTLADLLPPASLPFTTHGGWSNLQMVDPTPGAADRGILVYKLETTGAIKAGNVSSAFTPENRIDY